MFSFFPKKNAKKKEPRRSPEHHKGRSLSFESLEKREVMAANVMATLTSGILTIEGTQASDTIVVRNDGTKVSVDGVILAQNRYSVNSVVVNGLEGNDTIKMIESGTGSSSPIPMTVNGGWGNDTIYGGSAADKLNGFAVQDAEAASYDNSLGLYVANDGEHLNAGGKQEKWLMSAHSGWYFIVPNGGLYHQTQYGQAVGTLVYQFDPSYYEDLPQLAEAGSGPQAHELDKTYDLFISGFDVHLNAGGKNEKWLQSAGGQWYFILPDGGVYRQTVYGQAVGTLAAQLDPSYYDRLYLVYSAANYDYDADTIHGGAGNDVIKGGSDDDYLYGDVGKDLIRGNSGNDWIYGGTENDTLIGDEGGDHLYGEAGNDVLWGAAVDNVYSYMDGTNYLFGGDNNDNLYGGNSSDYLYGAAGNDGLFGGGGTNYLNGGSGADRYLDWESETNTLDYPEPQDATIRFLNSSALNNVAPPSGWPTDASNPYNFKAGNWTEAEIAAADAAFSVLHQVVNSTKLLKMPDGSPYAFTRRGQQTSGGSRTDNWDYGGQNFNNGNIIIAQARNPTLPNDVLQQTIYHEIGHAWDHSSVNNQFPAFLKISGWETRDLPVPSSPNYATELDNYSTFTNTHTASGANDDNWWYLNTASFARDTAPKYSDYSRLSPYEDYATTWETYFMDIYHGTTLGNQRVQAKYDNVTAFLNSVRTP